MRRNLQSDEPDFDYMQLLLDTASRAAITLPAASIRPALAKALETGLDQWPERLHDVGLMLKLETLVRIARLPSFHVDLWRAQTLYFDCLKEFLSRELPAPSQAWLRHFKTLGQCLGINVDSLSALDPGQDQHLGNLGTAPAADEARQVLPA
jgi:hypothetical protein